MERNWTIRNTSTGEYAHLYTEEEAEKRRTLWMQRGDAERDIEIQWSPAAGHATPRTP